MTSEFTLTQNDHSNEKTRTSYRVSDIVDLATLDAANAAMAAMITAQGNITNSVLKSKKVSLGTVVVNNAIPASLDSQRERKIVIKYEDVATADLYSLEIGCADTDALVIPSGTDLITLADGAFMAAYVTAFEANVKSANGNAVTVISATLVGRNL